MSKKEIRAGLRRVGFRFYLDYNNTHQGWVCRTSWEENPELITWYRFR